LAIGIDEQIILVLDSYHASPELLWNIQITLCSWIVWFLYNRGHTRPASVNPTKDFFKS